MQIMFCFNIEFMNVFLFFLLDIVFKKVFNFILILKRKYVILNKFRKGLMFKEIWDILNGFFKDWNKKFVLLLNDERYLWRDVFYKFKYLMNEIEVKRIKKLYRCLKYEYGFIKGKLILMEVMIMIFKLS